MKVALNKVEWVEKVYPRKKSKTDDAAVQRYRNNIDGLPPVVLAKNTNVLIDGYHRWLAHRAEGKKEIEVEFIDIDESEYLAEAIRRNSKHGLQLSTEDKRELAKMLVSTHSISTIANLLATKERVVRDWTKEARKELKERQNERILELYLACLTETDIASDLDDTFPLPEGEKWERITVHKRVESIIVKIGKSAEININSAPESLSPYNLWSFQKPSDAGGKYPGRMPGQVVENLLWYFTEPFDIILDPMAGSGTTVDVSKRMYRRCQAFDIVSEPEKRIDEHDITTGIPGRTDKDGKPKLILLDPPYWAQKKGEYSDDDTNLTNLPLDLFHETCVNIIKQSLDRVVEGGYVAFIISPSQKKGAITDHAAELIKTFRVPDHRVIVPYTTQQVTGADVEQAKKGKYMLKLYRDLLIWKKSGKSVS